VFLTFEKLSHFINFKNKREVAFLDFNHQKSIMFTRVLQNGLILLILSLIGACTTPPEQRQASSRPPVGIIRSVNQAERYVVYEAEFQLSAGSKMRILRDGKTVGQLQAGTFRRQKFQVADLLEGRPLPGDLAEPILPVKPQPAEQAQGRRLRP
jgi:hypothetical protein